MSESHLIESTIEDQIVERARRDVERRRGTAALNRDQAKHPSAVAAWIFGHWLATVNAVNGVIVGGTVLAPWLRANGHDWLAGAVYGFYRLQCPQRPDHSFFIFAESMGMEQRMVAIYAGWFLIGLLFVLVRRRLKSLSFAVLALASLPMALDLGTQMAGLRDTSWQLRVTTGILFAVATGWWALPRAESRMTAAAAKALAPPSGAGVASGSD